MQYVKPKVFHVAGTQINPTGMQSYLNHIGAPDWTTDTDKSGEYLVEVAGKTCYRSFSEDLNANLSKVRRNDNRGYLGNILTSKHGSVLEHVHDSFILVGVSRVFTHEMVRHRVSNFSQESLRFVRLTDLSAYFPAAFREDFLVQLGLETKEAVEKEQYLRSKMTEVFEYLEDVQLELANELNLDGLKNFSKKKKLTSSMRRLAPIGLATTILVTSNARNWRHVIAARTHRSAEEEIRLAMAEIFQILRNLNPNIYQDASTEMVDGILEVTFENEKV